MDSRGQEDWQIAIVIGAAILLVVALIAIATSQAPPRPGGESCDEHTKCYSGSCQNGVCPYSQRGEKCQNIAYCQPNQNLVCKGGKCMAPEDLGFLCAIKIPFTDKYLKDDSSIMWFLLLVGTIGTGLFAFATTKVHEIKGMGITISFAIICFLALVFWLILTFSC